MFKFILGQRKRLAALTAVILIVQSLLPTGFLGIGKALAGAATFWQFDNASDYTLDSGLTTFDYDGLGSGVLHFKINSFSSTGVGTGLPGGASIVQTLWANDINNRAWAVLSNGLLFYSDDSGATWTIKDIGGGALVTEMLQLDPSPSVPQAYLVAVGYVPANTPYIAYSVDSGTNWSASDVSAISAKLVGVSYAWGSSVIYTVTSGGAVFKSADYAHTWVTAKSNPVTGEVKLAKDIVALNANTVLVSGSNATVNAVVMYTSTGTDPWTIASLPGSPGSVITTLGYVDNWVYAADQNYIVSNGSGVFNQAPNWTDISANLNSGSFAAGAYIFGGKLSNITFIKVKAGANNSLYSTLDHGGHWLLHTTEASADTQSGTLAWKNDGSQIMWGGTNGAASDVWVTSPNVVGTSAITKNGVNISKIDSLTVTYHSLNYGEAYLSLGNNSNDAGPWYYFDGSWKSSGIDDPAYATAASALTPDALTILPISGTIYFKIYPKYTYSTMLLDALSIAYEPPGGGGPGLDQTAPTSQVNALPRYSTVPDLCDPKLTVKASASDNTGGSGLKQVSLYVSTNGNDFALWEDVSNPDHSTPYEWVIPISDNQFPSNQIYYFYSIAEDNAGNVEGPPTNPDWDTFTTVDVVPPNLLSSTAPADGSGDVPLNQPVVLDFSEPMLPESLSFEFTLADPPGSAVTNTNVQWSNQDQTATITHSPLAYSTKYRFYITSATDLAGNQLVDAPIRCPGRGRLTIIWPPLEFFFTTVARQDPDLRNSALTVADGPNADKTYNPNDNAEYTLRLVNTSIYGADNATATINFAAGISFVEAKDTRFRTIEQSGKVIGLIWSGSVPGSGSGANEVTAKYVMRVDSPANQLAIAQTVTIDDGANPPFVPQPPAMLYIARHPQFDTSSKTVDSSRAMPGDLLTYAIAIRNTGSTVVDVELADYVPAESSTDRQLPIFFKPGSITYDPNDSRWVTPPYYDTVTQTIRAVASGVLPGSASLTLGFQAVVRGDITEETDFVNTAYVWDPNIDPPQRTPLTASTHVPGPKPPLRITLQSPTPNTQNNALKQNIEVGFNSSVDLAKPFEYSLSENGRQITGDDLALWNPSWGTFNSIPNTLFTLAPPLDPLSYNGELAVGADYTVSIVAATNTDGRGLEGAPVTWGFTTADPMVRITTPSGSWYELLVNTLSDPFTVTLIDGITGQQYKAEEDITIGLRAFLGGALRASGSFWAGGQHPLGAIPKITISKGDSSAIFYYRDSAVSTPNYVTVRAFEDPYRGWPDDEKYVEVVDTEQPAESLILDAPSGITVGRFSAPITVGAINAKGSTRFLPQGRLYLYTDAVSGAFYDSTQRKLPLLSGAGGATIQDVAPQYIDIGSNIVTLTLYYRSNQAGTEKITVSDNSPQLPDTGLNDASAILKIEAVKEEELLKELEDVEDDSGRVIERMTIDPTDVTLLPKGNQTFKAVGYDTEDKPIDILKFKWFVLVTGSGTIERDGHGDDSHASVFTAGDKLGNYYDTVLAATLYNGKLAYATATVRITDVVNYKGPRKLPTTGMNGLQLILLGLTLVAAVALAWVEHYDKTHFKPQGNK